MVALGGVLGATEAAAPGPFGGATGPTGLVGMGVSGGGTASCPFAGAFEGACAPTEAAVLWDFVGGGEDAGGRDKERVIELGFALSTWA